MTNAANTSLAIGSLERLNQLVTDTLMVPLRMVVSDEFGTRPSKMSLLLDRPNESLGVRVAVGYTKRCLNDSHIRARRPPDL
jgi:hypothetical protein